MLLSIRNILHDTYRPNICFLDLCSVSNDLTLNAHTNGLEMILRHTYKVMSFCAQVGLKSCHRIM